METNQTPDQRICFDCQHKIPWDWVFCAWCGFENDKPSPGERIRPQNPHNPDGGTPSSRETLTSNLISKLRSALQKYGTHADYCALYKGPADEGCNCGLFEALGLSSDGNPLSDYPYAHETPAEAPCQHEWFEGRCVHCRRLSPHGSAQETSGDCQHDLLRPDTTIEVIDQWKAKCKVCITFFDLPGRPAPKASVAADTDGYVAGYSD